MGIERNLVNDERLYDVFLGVMLRSRAFRPLLFTRSSLKGLPPQSMKPSAVHYEQLQ